MSIEIEIPTTEPRTIIVDVKGLERMTFYGAKYYINHTGTIVTVVHDKGRAVFSHISLLCLEVVGD